MAESENPSSDETIPRKKVKVEEDDFAGSSSTEQKKPIRPAVNMLKTLDVKLGKKDKEYTRFDTNGKETILDMVKRMIDEAGCGPNKPNTDWLLFQCDSDKSYLNIGLPTGALSEQERYTCSDKKREDPHKYFTQMIRHYIVEDFNESWKLSSFNVKFEKNKHHLVSAMQRIVDVVRVNYFPGESLFEALLFDGRFTHTNALHSTDFETENGNKVFLSSQAKNDTFTMTRRRKPNTKTELAEKQIHPALGKPPGASVKQEFADPQTLISNVRPKSHSYISLVNTSGNSAGQTSNSGPSPPDTQITCDKDLEEFLEKHFGIEVQKQADQKKEKTRISKIKKLFSSHYDKFALKRGNLRSASKMKDLTKMFDSVGAVVAELDSNEEVFMGTCFVIGSKYVITNKHVIEDTLGKIGFKDFYVDFKYENGCNGYKFRFSKEPVVSSAVNIALDYAILELRDHNSSELPPSLTKCGYVIPNIDHYIDTSDWLTLIGYPQQADGKVMEDACPLNSLEYLDENFIVALSQQSPLDYVVLMDKRRQTFHTGGFFNGSSGSPGVLMNEKLLIILHCRGFPLQDGGGSLVEQGVRMSAIRDDVEGKIKDGILPGYTLNELFEQKEEPMEIDPNV